MTIIVDQDGMVYQRDLGAEIVRRVAASERFDPHCPRTPIPEEHGEAATPEERG